MAVIAYPYFPDRLEDQYPLLIADVIDLKYSGHHECVAQMIRMVADLSQNGLDSRYYKAFGGPIAELKSRSRGGDKGGARVYLFRALKDTFFVCRAECKSESQADAVLLADTAEIATAYRLNQPIFPSREWRGRERSTP